MAFNTQLRCADPASVSGCDATADFPDTPYDLSCGPTSCPALNHKAPTFWTDRRLHSVMTQVWMTSSLPEGGESGAWRAAGWRELEQSFPTPPLDQYGNTSPGKMQLDRITPRPGGDFAWSAFTQLEAEKADALAGGRTEYRFYRGMDGDRGGWSDHITLRDGSARPDHNWLRGQIAEIRRIGAAGVITNGVLSRRATVYTWTLTAGSGREGAYFVGAQIVTGTVHGSISKTTRAEFTYDAYGNVICEARLGDVSTPADDHVIERAFVGAIPSGRGDSVPVSASRSSRCGTRPDTRTD